jgi:hypothetical protein
LTRALLSFLITGAITAAQSSKPAPEKASVPRRANELTLAGLRPGRDGVIKAKSKFGTKDMSTENESVSWTCAGWKVTLDLADQRVIRTVILQENPSYVEKSPKNKISELPIPCYLKISATGLQLEQGKGFEVKNLWTTGKGLALGDSTARLLRIYGKPDSLSPSTRDGQPLELWYYAFDWAGPDVPQVMEVLCTKEKDGKPGHVIEITLAAPSL